MKQKMNIEQFTFENIETSINNASARFRIAFKKKIGVKIRKSLKPMQAFVSFKLRSGSLDVQRRKY
jgi:hypothetical protein